MILPREQLRMRELMNQYQDVPMDLADASLVVTAETLGRRRIFTLDSDFYVYRIKGKEAFIVIPASLDHVDWARGKQAELLV